MCTVCLLALLVAVRPAEAAEGLTVLAAELHEPFGMAFTPDGNLVLVEFGGHRVVRVGKDGKVTPIAGSGTKGDADGPGDRAQFNAPHNLAVARNGDIYVADTFNHRVRKIDGKTREVSTVAGTGVKGFSGDGGPATEARFDQTYHVALDPAGKSLYVCDLGNRRIRMIDLASGTVRTVTGNGKKGVPKDGTPAAEAPLVDPRAVEVDRDGNLWILERSGNALRVVEDGMVRTVAGTGKKGFSGDGGPALRAEFSGPKCLWVIPAGDVLIADTDNHVIRKYVRKAGMVERVAGSGTRGSGRIDRGLTGVELNQPHGVAMGPDGVLYIADSLNGRVLRTNGPYLPLPGNPVRSIRKGM